MKNKKSFKARLIIYFCLVSIIPTIAMNIVSYYKTTTIAQKNVDELTNINLLQTSNNLEIVLSSYEDLLYQMYTDDEIVELVDKINTNQNLAVSRNQLRRTLRGLANVKPYIQCITVITDNGTLVFYDKLASSTTNIAWLENYGKTSEELYEQISSTNLTDILPTKYALSFSAQPYYLFHMTHRIIDYKKINKKNGVIILSIDERMLNEICNQKTDEAKEEKLNNLNIILDESGAVVSFIEQDKIDISNLEMTSSEEEKETAYLQMAKASGWMAGNNLKAYSTYNEGLHWYIVNVSSQNSLIELLANQQRVTIFVIIFSVLALVIIIFFISNHLIGSIAKIVKAMKVAAKGELSVRVDIDEHMPAEIELIAEQFNNMIEKLNDSMENEKTATLKQKNAEIAALEAQINPHFLYNTLDTINWMAIDNDQYDISNAINSLGKILRYGVNKSNSIVAIREEVEWLKQYIFLQQTRLKNSFECNLNIEPNVMDYQIHKLLLQPFVENAIIHGFEGVNRKYKLEISIWEEINSINIKITDNGKGMTKDIVEQINNGLFDKNEEKNHIGVNNAIGRFQMYYGNLASVRFESTLGEGTSIHLVIPKIK